MTVDNFRTQGRGGKGIKGMTTIDNDFIEDLLMTSTHNHIMFFTNRGRAYMLKAYEIPEAGRTARGTAIINLLQLQPEEKISAVIPIEKFSEGKNLFMVTRKGIVKKTSIMDFANIRKNGLIAINLRDDDELIEVKQTDKDTHIFLVTKKGMCIRFLETDVRCLGRDTMGVKGMELNDDDEIVGMQLDHQGDSLLIVSENGIGKRSELEEFRMQKRGGKGLKCYKITEKTGDVVGVKAVTDDHEIMMITTGGIIIQVSMSEIPVHSRITSGVKMMNVAEGVKVARIAKVREKIEDADQPVPSTGDHSSPIEYPDSDSLDEFSDEIDDADDLDVITSESEISGEDTDNN